MTNTIILKDKDGKEHVFENAELQNVQKTIRVCEEKVKPWKPTEGDSGFWVQDCGTVRDVWDCELKYVLEWYAQGNVFQTREPAEREVKRREVTQKIREIAASDGWFADWSDPQQDKWCLEFSYVLDEWDCDYTYMNQTQGVIYMSEQSINRCIKELGDELDVLRD